MDHRSIFLFACNQFKFSLLRCGKSKQRICLSARCIKPQLGYYLKIKELRFAFPGLFKFDPIRNLKMQPLVHKLLSFIKISTKINSNSKVFNTGVQISISGNANKNGNKR